MIGGILKKILGDKSDKDRKAYQPIIDKVNQEFKHLASIPDDELRAKTDEFKTQIKTATAKLEEEIVSLEQKANAPDTPVTDKESIFERIDKLKEEIDKEIEKVLE